jgi:hypothetical protein
MSESQTKEEHVPTREELEREARRLARIRHLTVVPSLRVYAAEHDGSVDFHDFDPEPQEAA